MEEMHSFSSFMISFRKFDSLITKKFLHLRGALQHQKMSYKNGRENLSFM